MQMAITSAPEIVLDMMMLSLEFSCENAVEIYGLGAGRQNPALRSAEATLVGWVLWLPWAARPSAAHKCNANRRTGLAAVPDAGSGDNFGVPGEHRDVTARPIVSSLITIREQS
jgi:hypothetical protein